MSRYRLLLTPGQETGLLARCEHARFVWNLAVEQHAHWRPGRVSAPGYVEQARRWHIAFAAVPDPVPAPGNGLVVGVDRGVVVSAALSTGELLNVPGLTVGEQERRRRLQRRLARCGRGSNRRRRVKAAIATLKAREADRRKDWVEQTSTDLARRFDLVRVEDLHIRGMTRSAKGTAGTPGSRVRQKAGLNRGIFANAWGRLVTRLEHKASGRVEKINAARNIAAGRAVTARGALQPLGGAMNREPQPATSTA